MQTVVQFRLAFPHPIPEHVSLFSEKVICSIFNNHYPHKYSSRWMSNYMENMHFPFPSPLPSGFGRKGSMSNLWSVSSYTYDGVFIMAVGEKRLWIIRFLRSPTLFARTDNPLANSRSKRVEIQLFIHYFHKIYNEITIEIKIKPNQQGWTGEKRNEFLIRRKRISMLLRLWSNYWRDRNKCPL